jgi:hypothetical protein
MSFLWPAIDEEAILEEALGIALRYFDLPQDEAEYADVESRAGHAIMEDWRRGVRNKAVLATPKSRSITRSGRDCAERREQHHMPCSSNALRQVRLSRSRCLQTLLDDTIAFRQQMSAKPRRVARASLMLLRRVGLRLCGAAISQNERRNCYQGNSMHRLPPTYDTTARQARTRDFAQVPS